MAALTRVLKSGARDLPVLCPTAAVLKKPSFPNPGVRSSVNSRHYPRFSGLRACKHRPLACPPCASLYRVRPVSGTRPLARPPLQLSSSVLPFSLGYRDRRLLEADAPTGGWPVLGREGGAARCAPSGHDRPAVRAAPEVRPAVGARPVRAHGPRWRSRRSPHCPIARLQPRPPARLGGRWRSRHRVGASRKCVVLTRGLQHGKSGFR